MGVSRRCGSGFLGMVGCGRARVELHALIVARAFYGGKCQLDGSGPGGRTTEAYVAPLAVSGRGNRTDCLRRVVAALGYQVPEGPRQHPRRRPGRPNGNPPGFRLYSLHPHGALGAPNPACVGIRVEWDRGVKRKSWLPLAPRRLMQVESGRLAMRLELPSGGLEKNTMPLHPVDPSDFAVAGKHPIELFPPAALKSPRGDETSVMLSVHRLKMILGKQPRGIGRQVIIGWRWGLVWPNVNTHLSLKALKPEMERARLQTSVPCQGVLLSASCPGKGSRSFMIPHRAGLFAFTASEIVEELLCLLVSILILDL